VHERIEYERYIKDAQQLQEEVSSLNQDETEGTDVTDEGVTVRIAQHIHQDMRLESVQVLRQPYNKHPFVENILDH